MSEEIWKQIPGHTFYDVSTHGRVRTWNNNGNNREGRRNEPKRLKPGSNSGRPQVQLCENAQCKPFKVHVLVLTAFVGPCPPGMECCHRDGNSANNHLSNLRWDTRSANVRDAIMHGTHVSPPLHQGEAHHCAKLNEAQVIEIRALYAQGGISYRALAAQFGVTFSNIGRVIRRKTWAHVQGE